MKHYLDRDGQETEWSGAAKHIGDHEYFCAHHPDARLVDVTRNPNKHRYQVRTHADVDYYCLLCEAGAPTVEVESPAPGEG